MPLVACGYQGVEVAEMLEPLVDAAVHWIKHGLPVDDLKIVAQSAGQAAEMQRVFSLLKPRYSQIEPASPRKLQYDLFISYSHQNAEAARLLTERLRGMKQDLRVFLDRNEIDAGSSWQQKIFEALDDCRVVVAVYSPDYLESKVCKEEFNIAWIRHRESAEGVLVPVYLFSATLPTYMKLMHFIDCREGDEDKLACGM